VEGPAKTMNYVSEDSWSLSRDSNPNYCEVATCSLEADHGNHVASGGNIYIIFLLEIHGQLGHSHGKRQKKYG
jgi:hypothetical protein